MPSVDAMYAMLRPVLEERMQLKAHRDTRESPVYALEKGSGAHRLRPFIAGDCERLDPARPREPSRTPGKFPCAVRVVSQKDSLVVLDVLGATLEQFSRLLALDRPTLDQTGITGEYDFHLEFAGDGTMSGVPRSNDPSAGPSIFTAVQEQLGLRLSPTRGPGDVVVIEHVERPSPN